MKVATRYHNPASYLLPDLTNCQIFTDTAADLYLIASAICAGRLSLNRHLRSPITLGLRPGFQIYKTYSISENVASEAKKRRKSSVHQTYTSILQRSLCRHGGFQKYLLYIKRGQINTQAWAHCRRNRNLLQIDTLRCARFQLFQLHQNGLQVLQ